MLVASGETVSKWHIGGEDSGVFRGTFAFIDSASRGERGLSASASERQLTSLEWCRLTENNALA
jgi:hypothetical protein